MKAAIIDQLFTGMPDDFSNEDIELRAEVIFQYVQQQMHSAMVHGEDRQFATAIRARAAPVLCAATTGGTAAGAGKHRQRPSSGSGVDQPGDARNSDEVCRMTTSPDCWYASRARAKPPRLFACFTRMLTVK
jgi:hypothetical protein